MRKFDWKSFGVRRRMVHPSEHSVAAIKNLNRRVSAIEEAQMPDADLGPEVMRMMGQKQLEEMDLQFRVDEFVAWVKGLTHPDISAEGTEACVGATKGEMLAKLRELGLVEKP